MNAATFCGIDFETANGSRASVCSVGLVRIDAQNGTILAETGGLITPHPAHSAFLPGNVRVHGITAEHVRAARGPEWPQALRLIREFVGDDLLVAHNASFERSVIRSASAAYLIEPPPFDFVCTVKLARAMLPELTKHKLPIVAEHLGVLGGQHHDALDDARMCGLIAARLIERTAPGTTLAQLAAKHGQQFPRRRLAGSR